MARPRKRPMRFLDEPYLTTLLDLEQLQRGLRVLASRQHSPLPDRMRQQLRQMARHLARMRRELHEQPEAITQERDAEERTPRRRH